MKIYFLCAVFFSSFVYAANFICPNTYQTVSTGYTTEQVRAACGNPTHTNTQSGMVNIPIRYEQWVYMASDSISNLPDSRDRQEKAQLIITFNNKGTVESLSTKNTISTTIFPCFDFNQIQIGATQDAVQGQCGSPTFVNAIERSLNQQQNITTWTYNYGEYRPQIIFTFQDDKLTDIRTGQLGDKTNPPTDVHS